MTSRRRPARPVPGFGSILARAKDEPGLLRQVGEQLEDYLRDLGEESYNGRGAGHAAMHLPAGADPLTTGTPVATSTANSAGSAESYALSDHVHQQGIVTTKGDVLSFSSVPARLGVGANDTTLMADSAEATGLKWNTVATLLSKILTTKGDLLAFSTTPERVAVGTTGTSLVADAAQTPGVAWSRGWKGYRTKTLVNTTATGILEIALPTETDCGGSMTIRVRVRDAANETQTVTMALTFNALNKGGAYQVDVVGGADTDATSAKSVSTGTLAVTTALVSGADKVTLEVTATSSLTPTTLEACFVLDECSAQVVTFL